MRITTKTKAGLAAVLFASFVSLSARTNAAPLYSISNLGTADPSSNYLNLLGAADQAVFRAGSFDTTAHPATATSLPSAFYNGDVDSQYGATINDTITRPWMASSNNSGQNVGLAEYSFPTGQGLVGKQAIAVFTSSPHTIMRPSETPQTPIQSPGFIYAIGDQYSTFSNYIKSVSGMNDHMMVVGTANRVNYNDGTYPFAQTGGPAWQDINLGSLGGKNGSAEALNNSGQVVGWSETADGAHHAFVYASGSLQDLNLTIPPISGTVLTDAVGIDSAGRIVALGTDSSGNTHEYLLSPIAVPEPSILAFACFALAALAVRARLRK